MATGKINFWLKLRKDFLFGDEAGYLMSLPNMGKYIILYWQLCALAINTGGELVAKVGKIKAPYTVERIQQECKYHSIDEVRDGLNCLTDLGLISRQRNGTYRINDFAKLVGRETDYAEQKRKQRSKKGSEQISMDEGADTGMDISVDESVDNVHTDIRDKILDIRYIDFKRLDISDGDVAPGVSLIESYMQKRGLDPSQYFGTTDELMNTVGQITAHIFSKFATRLASGHDVTAVHNIVCQSEYVQEIDNWATRIDPDRLDLLMYAFEQASNSGNPGNWNYINGVLRNLAERRITTLAEAEEYDDNI